MYDTLNADRALGNREDDLHFYMASNSEADLASNLSHRATNAVDHETVGDAELKLFR